MSRLQPRIAVAVLAAISSSMSWAAVNGEAGAFLFQNYSGKTYSSSPQNWSAVQDPRGVIYIGNTDGVLEYDGVLWRTIPLANRSVARALAIDSLGTVYIGGQGTFGYLTPDAHGAPGFVSLVSRVPKADRDFGDVWNVLPTPIGVLFSSHRRLFLLSPNGAIKVWRPTAEFGRAFFAYGDIFVNTSDRGLLQIRDGELVAGPGGESPLFRGSMYFAMGEHPILSDGQRLFRFTLSSIDNFPTEADSYFAQNRIYSLAQWPNGEIAVGTRSGGLVLLNRSGGIDRILDRSSGIPSDWITGIYIDSKDAVWITSAGGITRLNPSLTAFGEHEGIRGSLLAAGRLRGVLYAGTTTGLFRMAPVSHSEVRFEPVQGLQEAAFDMLDRSGVSLVGAQHGLYDVSGTRASRILAADVIYNVTPSLHDPNTFYTAGRDGIYVLQHNGSRWEVKAHESGTGQEFRTVIEDADGRVWATTRVDIWRIDFRPQPRTIERFAARDGVPAGWKNAYSFHGHTVFATEKGLLRFSETERHFLPDPELGAQFSDGSHPVSIVREDPLHNVWVTGQGYHGVLRPRLAGGYTWFAKPLLESGMDEMWTIHTDADGTCWAAGESGLLYRWEPPPPNRHGDDFNVLLREVNVSGQDTPLYGGDGPLRSVLQLPYRDNALRFEFSAPFYGAASEVEYQVRLEGSEKHWEPWTAETRKDYTNLPERKYKFHVRARNPQGAVSPEAVFSFGVLPPWYRTWWSYAIYVAGFLYAGWLILRWRLRILEAKNKWLEQVVAERTAEVRQERDQNEALLLNILPSPVAAELRVTGAVKPATFDDVTVCFSDFVGFTLSTERLPASEVITSLNEYFTAFDEIIGRYGLEKLKTIGDAYMFAGGLPNTSPSHAVDAVMAALEMVAASRRLAHPERGLNWRIRLGLYSGPVVAGVVGVRKFAFDIWGNTVNLAARMESAGFPDRVNLSSTTCQRISDFIACESRGPVRIKEGREMEMHFAVGPRPELLTGPLVGGVPEAFRRKYEQAFGKPPRAFPDLAALEAQYAVSGSR